LWDLGDTEQMRDKILISGGAGYVGTLLIQEFQKKHFTRENLICVDQGLFGFNEIHKKCLLPDNIYRSSIRSFTASKGLMATILRNTKTVIHLAGLSNDPMADYDAVANKDMNCTQTEMLADACAEHGVPRFIFASSASVYGDMEENLCKENGPISPKSNYALSKAMGEKYLLNKKGLNPVILRKGTLYGVSPRMRLDLAINTMVMNAVKFKRIELWGGGENWRPLTHINDAVNLYIKIAMMNDNEYKKFAKGKIYNVVGKNYRMSELGLQIANIMDVPVKSRYDMPKDVRTYRMDSSKLFENTIFEFNNNLGQAIHDIKSWVGCHDIDDPIYYNMKWIKNCEKVFNSFNMRFTLV
jgi:nucleoside-diphosphate-sugar epimerase